MSLPKIFGTPAAWESADLWQSNNEANAVSGNEFEIALTALERMLSNWLRKNKVAKNACYFRGDFFGDRTQYLVLNDKSVLTPKLIQAIQSKLASDYTDWRVAIPTPGAPGKAIMIYPSIVRYWNEEKFNLEEAISYMK